MITDFTLPHGGCETLARRLAYAGRLVDYLAVNEGNQRHEGRDQVLPLKMYFMVSAATDMDNWYKQVAAVDMDFCI